MVVWLIYSFQANYLEKFILFVYLMVFNATYIVAVSFIGGGPGENHRPVASYRQTLSHNVVHTKYETMCEVLWRNISDFYVNLAMYFYLEQE
jgi:hypothetical protein